MRIFKPLILCIMLTSCQQTQDTATNAYGTVGEETGKTYDKIGEIIGIKPPPKPKSVKAETRYCYRTYNDVICYSRPLLGEEYRLVGYQEANGKTGYVIDPSQEMQMDAPAAKSAATGASSAKSADAPPLKSVNVGLPPAVKAVPEKQLKEVIFDPAELEPKELVPDKPQ